MMRGMRFVTYVKVIEVRCEPSFLIITEDFNDENEGNVELIHEREYNDDARFVRLAENSNDENDVDRENMSGEHDVDVVESLASWVQNKQNTRQQNSRDSATDTYSTTGIKFRRESKSADKHSSRRNAGDAHGLRRPSYKISVCNAQRFSRLP